MARRGRGSRAAVTDRDNPGGGGLTGATGDLTPDAPDQAFVPGERDEVAGPVRAQVTYRQGSAAPAQRGDIGEPGQEASEIGLTNLAERESGYASEHGLSPTDPAYAMDVHPPAGSQEESPQPETSIGGDHRTENEERF